MTFFGPGAATPLHSTHFRLFRNMEIGTSLFRMGNCAATCARFDGEVFLLLDYSRGRNGSSLSYDGFMIPHRALVAQVFLWLREQQIDLVSMNL